MGSRQRVRYYNSNKPITARRTSLLSSAHCALTPSTTLLAAGLVLCCAPRSHST